MKIICIEGNIGSGKSTLVDNLKRKYAGREDICFLQEPVEQWLQIKDTDGVNILEKYYKDQHTYAFPFQMMAYISRLSILKKAIENPKYKYIITERCLFTDKYVFCQMLYDDGFIDSIGFQIYNKWFDEFNYFESVTYSYVYIQTDPTISKYRVDKRSRSEETIPLAYLEKCHLYHEAWLDKKGRIVILDGNQDTCINPDISDWYNKIDKLLN
jgi:deoxyadenosine/deoxycytidine kinase